MTRDDIVRLWEKANGWSVKDFDNTIDDLERFAALVAAAEREECAKLVENINYDRYEPETTFAAAIRARLAQEEPDIDKLRTDALIKADKELWEKCCAKVLMKGMGIAQPEPEPVAELWQHGETGRTRIVTPDMLWDALITECDASWLKVSDLYTAPPQRKEWVGLMDEEISDTQQAFYKLVTFYDKDFARAIEAKLKEKNK